MVAIRAEDITAVAGHPAVGLTITGSGTATVTRTVAGFTWPVRTGRGIRVSGSDFIEDHEAPIGVEVAYRVTVGSESADTSILLRSDRAWISDPLDWTSGIPMTMGDVRDDTVPLLTVGTLDVVKRGVGGSAVTPMGGRLPVRLGASRRAPSALRAVVTTWDQEQADALGALVEGAGILLLRVPHDPQRALSWGGHMAVDVTAEWAPGGAVDWTLDGDVVTPPALPVLIIRSTYDQVAAVTGARTYAQVRNLQGHFTYSDVKRDPLVGIGG